MSTVPRRKSFFENRFSIEEVLRAGTETRPYLYIIFFTELVESVEVAFGIHQVR